MAHWLKFPVQQMIRRKRRAAPLGMLANVAHKYLKFWYNEDFYQFNHNGEAFALDCFVRWSAGRPTNVWDVGAHRGEWADEALARLTRANVHSFEVIPWIARDIPTHERRTVHPFGLSNRPGVEEITYNPVHDMMSTFNVVTMNNTDPNFSDAQRVSCEVTTGDIICQEIGTPDLLKIDTEGHERAVLQGCRGIINSAEPPAMIQIEYGVTYLAAGSNLLQIYDLLPGYSIGRLYPDHVEFRPYCWADDHFRMGNMVAVRDEALMKMLRN